MKSGFYSIEKASEIDISPSNKKSAECLRLVVPNKPTKQYLAQLKSFIKDLRKREKSVEIEFAWDPCTYDRYGKATLKQRYEQHSAGVAQANLLQFMEQ
jgi:hypothetical protein